MNLCGFEVGNDRPFFLIAGPCVIESEALALSTAETLKKTDRPPRPRPSSTKSSFDKVQPLLRRELPRPRHRRRPAHPRQSQSRNRRAVITDVHEDTPLDEVASVVDVLQTPAFLCRQTNFIHNVCKQGLPVNIKKGQFLAPWDMRHVAEKAKSTGNEHIMLCERGVSFGYNNLVSDMRALSVMQETGCPVVFDATHSVQLPGGQGASSGGQREFVPVLARAAVAVGVAGPVSWKPIPTRITPSPTDRTPGHWEKCHCYSNN